MAEDAVGIRMISSPDQLCMNSFPSFLAQDSEVPRSRPARITKGSRGRGVGTVDAEQNSWRYYLVWMFLFSRFNERQVLAS